MRTPKLGVWVVWQTVGLLLIVTAPAFVSFRRPVWEIATTDLPQFLAYGGSFVLASVVLTILLARYGELKLPMVLVVTAAALSLGLFALLLIGGPYRRTVLVLSCGFAATWIAIPVLVARRLRMREWGIGAVALLGLVMLTALGTDSVATREKNVVEARRVETLVTNELPVEAVYFTGVETEGPGGGLDAFGDGYVVASRRGVLRFVVVPEDEGLLQVRDLPIEPPDFGDYSGDLPTFVTVDRIQTNDLEVFEGVDGPRLLMSHTFWDQGRRCMTVRLSSMVVEGRDILPSSGDGWRTLHEATPCLPFEGASELWSYRETAGRIVQIDQEHVLYSVANPEDPVYSQDPASDFGRTLQINVVTGEASVFTSGHRNAQGLAMDGNGRAWLTEHGPQGGDELNLLEAGTNYGWPVKTLGVEYVIGVATDYSHLEVPDDLRDPFFSWVPSIAPSQVIALRGDLFQAWRGDLLVGSLRRKAVFRLRVSNGGVLFAEPFEIGLRVRDLIEGPDGRIIVWTDEGRVVALSPRSYEDSDELLATCLGCHLWADDEVRAGAAPPLKGVVGRPIGRSPQFEYSDALRSADGFWLPGLLSSYLENPTRLYPGTSMAFAGIPDSLSRARLIQVLETRQ